MAGGAYGEEGEPPDLETRDITDGASDSSSTSNVVTRKRGRAKKSLILYRRRKTVSHPSSKIQL